jgi:hypothetical protein
MEATAARRLSGRLRGALRGVDRHAVAVWLMAFGLVLYLALRGGGYDPLVRDEVGIAVWWITLAAVLAGVVPVRRPRRLALAAIGLLAAYVVWVALSLAWSESLERTMADLARVATYLGVFTLAVFARGPKGARRLIAALAAAIVVVALLGLASRLHPAWFPDAGQTGEFLPGARSRLGYPLNYWNGLAALIALGLPLIVHLASSARSTALRSALAGLLPALALTIFFTFSRGGLVACVAGLVVLVALTPNRARSLMVMLMGGIGAAILIGAATQRNALESGLAGVVARQQGDELLVMTIVVCAGVALLHAAVSLALPGSEKQRLRVPAPRFVFLGLAGLLVGAAIVATTAGAPGWASDQWSAFKSVDNPGGGANRLGSFAGNGRYQYWSTALDENASARVAGTGSGTYEYWWLRDGDGGGFVRDAHSLYFESLGELGIVGLALILGFLGAVLVGGAVRLAGAATQRHGQLAAALGGCLAFCVAAAFDWIWELPVIPVAFLLLASVVVTAGDGAARRGLGWRWRIGTAGVALAAIVAIAIPLASTALLRQSQRDARSGNLAAALDAARAAQSVQPYAASPRLQEALVLERFGQTAAAAAAARAAAEREETNWSTWLVLSRLEAKLGNASKAIDAYRRARGLNPRSPLFAP